jgi:hypothetical protein
MTERYTERSQWEAAITALCAPYSWHTRSGIGAAQDCDSAFSGERYLGYWDRNSNQGWINPAA